MKINEITIPDAGNSIEYFADPIGGWLYEVTTSIVISQKRLDAFDDEVSRAQDNVSAAQAKLQTAIATKERFQEQIDQAKVQPKEPSATSTAAILP